MQPPVVSTIMRVFDILGIIAPGEGEDYDVDEPTKQTELLALSLRKLFVHLQGTGQENPGLQFRQLEEFDYSGVPDAVEALGEDVLTFLADSSGEYGLVPALPSLSAVITSLVPVMMTGGSGLAAFLPALLPYILEGGLQLIKHKLFAGGDNSEALQAIADNIYKGLVRVDETDEIPHLGYLNDMVMLFEQVAASLDSLDRLLQEIEEATPIAIMHTSEVDKVVYITP